jgi:pyridoxal phosphate enzyme (YggS family)
MTPLRIAEYLMGRIMTTIASNLQAVRNAISAAAVEAGRQPTEIKLLVVSKTFAPDALREAYRAGQTCFAESYVQEALVKLVALQDLPITWHYIGPIQSNKTRAIAENFSWVHSVDRLKIAVLIFRNCKYACRSTSAWRPVKAG